MYCDLVNSSVVEEVFQDFLDNYNNEVFLLSDMSSYIIKVIIKIFTYI